MNICLFPRKQPPYTNSSSSPAFPHEDQHKFRWIGTATFKYITFNCELTLISNPNAGLGDPALAKKNHQKTKTKHQTSFSFLHLGGPHSGAWSAPLLCAAIFTLAHMLYWCFCWRPTWIWWNYQRQLPHPDSCQQTVVVIETELSIHPRKGLAGRDQGAVTRQHATACSVSLLCIFCGWTERLQTPLYSV